MMGSRSYRGRLAATALLLLSGWEVAVLVNVRRRAPVDDDWRSVSAAIHRSARPGALILFAPRWIDPVGRQWLGDRISISQAARMDAARYGEIWEVSTRGAAAPEVARLTPDSDARFGAIRLRHFTREAPTVVWDLTSQSQLCEVDFEPRSGVRLELTHAGDERRVAVRGVRLGTELQAYGGVSDYLWRRENRATVQLTVLVDGKDVSRIAIGNDSGWTRLPAAVTSPGVHDVELRATIPDSSPSPVRAALCVAAEARETR